MIRMNSQARYAARFLAGLLSASFLIAPATLDGAELKEETLNAWGAYVQHANSEMDDRLHGPFLWVDEVPDRLQRVRTGDILVSSVGQHNPKAVPSGLIHHWMGAAFISGTKLEDVLATARDYSHYKEFYKPTVVDSRPLSSTGACDKYLMLLANKEVVAATALDSEYEACYHQVDERRWYGVVYTTRVQEIRHYGESDAKELPPGQGNGYVWRVYGFARFEERDGGVYIELEASVLSRDIPFAVRWVVDPIVRRISKNSMLISLRQTEEAVRARAGAAKESGSSPSSSEGVSISEPRHKP
jgi:hypothetical protein